MAAVPAKEKDFIFLSSGTWSLLGTELEQTVLTGATQNSGLSNEIGFEEKTAFLKTSTVFGLSRKAAASGNVREKIIPLPNWNSLHGKRRRFALSLIPTIMFSIKLATCPVRYANTASVPDNRRRKVWARLFAVFTKA